MRALFVLAILATPAGVHAQESAELSWGDRPRFDWGDGIVGGLGVLGGLSFFSIGAPERSRWSSTNELDLEVRNAILPADFAEREIYADVTDVIFFALLVTPILVDSVLVAGVARGSSDVALQTALLDVEVLALAFFLSMVTTRQVARERPHVRECRDEGRPISECGDGTGRNVSFMSGHAVFNFASAGLVCAHHMELGLFGEVWADATMCGASIALATAASIMRLPADRHWATDIIAGAGGGLLLGWLLPYLTRYAPWLRDANVQVLPAAPRSTAGLSVVGLLP